MSYKVSSWRTISRYSHKGQGAHAGDIETFIEVEFDLDGKKVVPDGLIRVSVAAASGRHLPRASGWRSPCPFGGLQRRH